MSEKGENKDQKMGGEGRPRDLGIKAGKKYQ
jgi:hypothetical protein